MCMVVAISPFMATRTYAASADLQSANALYELGLFKGTGVNANGSPEYSLDKNLSRPEAVVMLIRLLGQEKEALATTATNPFGDVPSWADKYISYAYEKGLTNGVSKDKFGSGKVDSQMYTTFVLRSMGYSDGNGKDFSWDKPYDLAKKVGIDVDSIDKTSFNRGSAAALSYDALSATISDGSKTLADKLIENGVFSAGKYEEAKKVFEENPPVIEAPKGLIPICDAEINEKLLSLNGRFETNPKNTWWTNYYPIYWENMAMYEKLDKILTSYSSRFAAIRAEDYPRGNGLTNNEEYPLVCVAAMRDASPRGKQYDNYAYQLWRLNEDGSCDMKTFYFTFDLYWKDAGVMKTLPIGEKDVNDYLLSCNPTAVLEAGAEDGTLYHVIFENDIEMYHKICSYFDGNPYYEEGPSEIYERNSMSFRCTRVELDLSNDGNVVYSIEQFDGNGRMETNSYWKHKPYWVYEEMIDEIPIGNKKANKYLLGSEPAAAYMVEEEGETIYIVIYEGLSMYETICSYFVKELGLEALHELTSERDSDELPFVRVAVFSNEEGEFYYVERVDGEGDCVGIEFEA